MITFNEFNDIWNEKHIEYIKQGSEIRNKLMIKLCEEYILAAKEAYYNTGDPMFDDNTYDKLEGYLRTLDPSNIISNKVGA